MLRFLIFSVLLVFAATNIPGQSLFSTDEMNRANTACKIRYLSEEEKNVILYMNLARLDGKKFYKSFITEYIKNYNTKYSKKIQSNNKYWVSLILDLHKTLGLRMIFPDSMLSEAASFHANDLGKTGVLGHTSSDGTNFPQRLKKFHPDLSSGGENCCCGEKLAIEIVCCLLLDDDVPSLGHRKNILSPDFNIVGVGIAPHSTCDPCCVIDFAYEKHIHGSDF